MHMTKHRINQAIAEAGYDDEGILLADGYEDAFIGFSAYQPNRPPCAIYDYNKCIKILHKRDKMSMEDAMEFFEFNTVGAWVGEHTPIFLMKPFF